MKGTRSQFIEGLESRCLFSAAPVHAAAVTTHVAAVHVVKKAISTATMVGTWSGTAETNNYKAPTYAISIQVTKQQGQRVIATFNLKAIGGRNGVVSEAMLQAHGNLDFIVPLPGGGYVSIVSALSTDKLHLMGRYCVFTPGEGFAIGVFSLNKTA